MQQLIITLIALLGMIVPVANTRMSKLFMRIVPPLTITGRVAADAPDATMSGQPQGRSPAGDANQAKPMIAPATRQGLFLAQTRSVGATLVTLDTGGTVLSFGAASSCRTFRAANGPVFKLYAAMAAAMAGSRAACCALV